MRNKIMNVGMILLFIGSVLSFLNREFTDAALALAIISLELLNRKIKTIESNKNK